jgi:hypothetical protein
VPRDPRSAPRTRGASRASDVPVLFPTSETPLAAPSSANGVAGSGPLRLLLRIVLRLGGPKPEQRQGCCGVAVPGVESGERLALATERTTPAVGLSSGIATIGLLIILYVFSDFARSQGQKIEPRIYKLQGGKPSVTMMRRDDTALDTDSKDRYRAFLASKLVRTAPTAAEEKQNQAGAASVWVLAFLAYGISRSIDHRSTLSAGHGL